MSTDDANNMADLNTKPVGKQQSNEKEIRSLRMAAKGSLVWSPMLRMAAKGNLVWSSMVFPRDSQLSLFLTLYSLKVDSNHVGLCLDMLHRH
eukprot:g1026.t1